MALPLLPLLLLLVLLPPPTARAALRGGDPDLLAASSSSASAPAAASAAAEGADAEGAEGAEGAARRLQEDSNPKEDANSARHSPWVQEVVAKHNAYRCMHGVPPMTWSTDLEAHAKQWAVMGRGQRSPPSQLQDVGPFSLVGENVATGVTDQGGSRSPAGAAQGWYDQISRAGSSTGEVDRYAAETAQYTQVVWKSSTSLGCALLNGNFVCQYGPAGNRPGEFQSQVEAVKKTSQECEQQR